MPWPPRSSNWIFPRWLIFRAWVLARNVRGLVVFLLRRTVSCLTFSLHHCHRRSCLCIKEALYTWRTRLTEQRDDMLTNQGETAVWMQMKAWNPVACADLSKSLEQKSDKCMTRYYLQTDDAHPRNKNIKFLKVAYFVSSWWKHKKMKNKYHL